MGYQPKPRHKNRIEQKKNGDDNLLVKIYKSASNTAGELDIVTLRNHAPRSYMTWLSVNFGVIDMIIV